MFQLSLHQALSLVTWGYAAASLLQTLEYLALRRHLQHRGVWSEHWLVAQDNDGIVSDRAHWHRVFAWPLTALVLAARLFAALALPWLDGATPMLVLVLSDLFIGYRWHGTFNGGSDLMTMQIGLALLGARLGGVTTEAPALALWYLRAQLTFTYVVAGLAKVREASWCSGEALGFFLEHHAMSRGARLGRYLRERSLLKPAAWGVMAFELSFPLAWIASPVALGFLLAAIAFHGANVLIFGLHRFLWIWLAAYPALFWAAN